MGLKSGSRDSGLDDADDSTEQDETPAESESEPSEAEQPSTETKPQSADESQETDEDGESNRGGSNATENDSNSTAPAVDSIPYKLRRSQVNEGREQVPYFLRQEVIDAEAQLKETLESELGETVYKSDYREAAMVVAQRQPELVAEVLREWGYDFGNG